MYKAHRYRILVSSVANADTEAVRTLLPPSKYVDSAALDRVFARKGSGAEVVASYPDAIAAEIIADRLRSHGAECVLIDVGASSLLSRLLGAIAAVIEARENPPPRTQTPASTERPAPRPPFKPLRDSIWDDFWGDVRARIGVAIAGLLLAAGAVAALWVVVIGDQLPDEQPAVERPAQPAPDDEASPEAIRRAADALQRAGAPGPATRSTAARAAEPSKPKTPGSRAVLIGLVSGALSGVLTALLFEALRQTRRRRLRIAAGVALAVAALVTLVVAWPDLRAGLDTPDTATTAARRDAKPARSGQGAAGRPEQTAPPATRDGDDAAGSGTAGEATSVAARVASLPRPTTPFAAMLSAVRQRADRGSDGSGVGDGSGVADGSGATDGSGGPGAARSDVRVAARIADLPRVACSRRRGDFGAMLCAIRAPSRPAPGAGEEAPGDPAAQEPAAAAGGAAAPGDGGAPAPAGEPGTGALPPPPAGGGGGAGPGAGAGPQPTAEAAAPGATKEPAPNARAAAGPRWRWWSVGFGLGLILTSVLLHRRRRTLESP